LRISLARRSSATSRRNRANSSFSPVVARSARSPRSASSCRAHSAAPRDGCRGHVRHV
jgi:hypothetical protein